ncbi:MAG: hypothetical protein ACI9O6_002646 [Glaciecola sp.]|jgi:hypothetical protein
MSLHQLVYISVATEKFSQESLFEILDVAKENNSHQDITGSLLYDSGRFIQILEGDRVAITSLFKTISEDPRHKSIRLLYLDETSIRLFPNWSMNMVNLKADKPKNLAVLKSLLNQIDTDKKIGTTHAALALFKAFKEGS